jgi:hypothetical protein
MDDLSGEETQERVNEVCQQHKIQGRVELIEDNRVWVFLEGDIRSKTDAEIQEIQQDIEAIEGVDGVGWSLP